MYWCTILGLVCILIRYITSQTECQPDASDFHRFGPNCEFQCHCMNNEACDVGTGACTSGCANHWMGPACQHREIAYRGYTRHLDNIAQFWSRRANDGDPNTCSETNDIRGRRTEGPWWLVYFGNEEKIRGITVTPKSSRIGDFQRGFIATVENTTDHTNYNSKPGNAKICYVQHQGTLSPTFEIRCSETLVGNQFRIQLDNLDTQLTICDIRIFGECGDNKRWGSSCQNNCHCYNDAPCDVKTGECPGDCAAGYRSPTCTDECEFGNYGIGCQMQCSSNCHKIVSSATWCNHVDGSCDGGCVPGWTGTFCDEECGPGYYGDGCKQQCSSNCRTDGSRSTPCNHVNGSCIDGCVPGWRRDLCENECSDGFYGEKCAFECSQNCLGGTENCHHITGRCINNCTHGWLGQHCDTVCRPGYYGEQCQQQCSGNCLHVASECHHVTGYCEGGCVAGWKNIRCSQGVEQNTSSPVPVAGIAGGVVAAVIVIGVVIVALLLLRRRRRNRERRSHTHSTDVPVQDQTTRGLNSERNHQTDCAFEISPDVEDAPYEELQMEVKESYANGENPYDLLETTCNYYSIPGDAHIPKHGICLSDLKDYVLKHSISGQLECEFTTIPYGLQYPVSNAVKPANRVKNRYRDIYPYDHARVLLNTIPGQPDSDYINACFVDGYMRKQAYIAAQGPTDTDAVDFWRVVWEKHVETIVMMTNSTENEKMACSEYWAADVKGDMFEVSITSEESFNSMIIRQMSLKLISQPGCRTVTQYHFRAWPEKSTPDDATGLVQFLLECRKGYADKDAPVVVHCSTGVGRTGTYIGLDILYQQGKDRGYVDVLGVVKRLREQRVNMVQTKGQYIFLHEAAHEALVLPSPVPVSKFPDEYNTRLERSQLREQYQSIAEVLLSSKIRDDMNDIKEEEDEFCVANQPANMSRNRYDDVLVSNEFRPLLCTQVDGCNSYINAVFVQSHRDSHGLLLSQAPMSHTAVDCCRLIVEQAISCVVVFDYDNLEEDEKYLSEAGTLTIGPFESQIVSSEEKTDYTINTHRIMYRGEKLDVRQFVYKGWHGAERAPSLKRLGSFLGLVDDVANVQRVTEGPILVHCLNGAAKSGLFAVLLHVMERMRTDGDVAIPQTIRLVRRRRPQIIPNYEQYKFCHDAVQYHLENSGRYANLETVVRQK